MPILFSCSKCRSQIRVPDGTEGKKTKCPQCQEIQEIPYGLSSSTGTGTSPPAVPPTTPQSTAKSDSMWDNLDLKSEPSTQKSNPFADGPDPFGAPSQNPYSSPHGSGTGYPRQVSRDSARSQLMGPAIGVLVSQVLGGSLLVIWLVATLVEIQDAPDIKGPAEAFGAGIMLLLMFGVPILVTLFTSFAMIRAMSVRNYGLVLTGFILSLTPLSGCIGCALALIFGIWGIVVMCDDSVKAAFREP